MSFQKNEILFDIGHKTGKEIFIILTGSVINDKKEKMSKPGQIYDSNFFIIKSRM